MTNPEKTDLVERLRELRAKAAEGPWYLEHAATTDGLTRIDDGRQHGMYAIECEAFEAELIVEAVTALPALLEAVEALEPFAALNEELLSWTNGTPVNVTVYHVGAPTTIKHAFNVGHLRRARAALATLKGEG